MTSDATHRPLELSVVIPAFNEESRIGATLRSVLDYLTQRSIDSEVIVVDDGSRDETVAVAERVGDPRIRIVQLPENQGKGAALRSGVLVSSGDWVLVTDADLSTPIEDLEKLQRWTEDADLIFGSRAVEGARIERHQPRHREWMGRTFNRILRLLGLTTLRDTQCGFKLLRGPVARELFRKLSVTRFAYDVELTWVAQRAGYRVVEVGVRWRDSPASRVRPLRDSMRMFWDVVKIRFRR